MAQNPKLTFWTLINGDPAGMLTALLLIVAYVVYALAYIIFCFFYTLFGSILYALGPLVLAILPIAGVGQLAKSYATNLMVWNAWGLIYSILAALITAIQVNQVNNVLGNGFLGFLRGQADSVILGMVSIFYALAIALIPFIAKRVISGDVGSAAVNLVKTAVTAAGVALAGAAGFAAGAAGLAAGITVAGGGATEGAAVSAAGAGMASAAGVARGLAAGVGAAAAGVAGGSVRRKQPPRGHRR